MKTAVIFMSGFFAISSFFAFNASAADAHSSTERISFPFPKVPVSLCGHKWTIDARKAPACVVSLGSLVATCSTNLLGCTFAIADSAQKCGLTDNDLRIAVNKCLSGDSLEVEPLFFDDNGNSFSALPLEN